jgi:hypothetical protein
MGTDVRHKFLEYEVTPPQAVWQHIAAELDECGLENRFPALLKNAEIAPPAAAWQNITAALEHNILSDTTTASLYEMEVPPPAAAWDTIKKTLAIEQEAAIPEHRRFAPFIKYAAAAAITGLLFWGGLSLFSGDKKDDTVAGIPNPVDVAPANNSFKIPDELITADVNAAAEEARNDAALEASKTVFAKVDVPALQRKIKNNLAISSYNSTDEYPSGSVRSIDMNDIYSNDEELIAEKYVTLMTPDGKLVRMSKKLGDLVCCISGEEQDLECIDQMKRWRDKMTNRPGVHAPGNFMDIVNLVSSLQDN